MEMNRRGLLGGALASLFAPSIVRASSLDAVLRGVPLDPYIMCMRGYGVVRTLPTGLLEATMGKKISPAMATALNLECGEDALTVRGIGYMAMRASELPELSWAGASFPSCWWLDIQAPDHLRKRPNPSLTDMSAAWTGHAVGAGGSARRGALHFYETSGSFTVSANGSEFMGGTLLSARAAMSAAPEWVSEADDQMKAMRAIGKAREAAGNVRIAPAW